MKLLFCGGGSAGHVVPNLAIMQELKGKYELTYAGSRGGIEEGLVRTFAVPFFGIDCPKLVRSFAPKNLTLPLRMVRANKEARALLEKLQPRLVFSKGGYASLPYLYAAVRLHIPALTHESDLSPGLVTRLAGSKCKYVLTSFEETAGRFANGKFVGPPIRGELFSGERASARKKYGFFGGKPVLLVLGGGSGSRTLNEAVKAQLDVLLEKFDILHLVGRGNAGSVQRARGYIVREYEPEMKDAYAAADCVLCRAGAGTAFEAIALGKPTLFVPLERATRGDQIENARYFQGRGLAHVLSERDLAALPEALFALQRDEALKERLAASPIKNGAGEIAALIEGMLR